MKYLKLFESFIENKFSSESFEKKLGLSTGILSKKWNFPCGFNEDEIWNLCDKVMWNPDQNNSENLNKLRLVSNDLTFQFFPYKGIEDLPEQTKFDILAGMSSRFNFDDIVWFSIDKKIFTHPDSKKVRDDLFSEFGISVDTDWNESEPGVKKLQASPGWVPSLTTLNSLRSLLNP